jgi:hypothetical protein
MREQMASFFLSFCRTTDFADHTDDEICRDSAEFFTEGNEGNKD